MRSLPVRTALFLGRCTALSLLVALGACSAGSSTGFPADRGVRPASDLPAYFLVGRLDSPETAEPVAGEGCRSPMVDPRDETRLRLVRSAAGQGDYEVPAGRYGTSGDDLLRLDCGTGRPLGIVKR